MRYVLGFDGGGTKTECVLINSENQVLARTFAGPSNPWRIGITAAAHNVEHAADLALGESGLTRTAIVALGAALAGTSDPNLKQGIHATLQSAFPGASITVLTDLEAALAAAGEGPVIVLVAGTGSAAIGRDAQGKVYRAGGYGRHSSDKGSAYDIGRQAVAAAVQQRTDTGADSALGVQMLQTVACMEWSVLEQRAQTVPDDVYPKLFPVIAAAADKGDATARAILLQAIIDLSSLVAEVADHLGLREQQFLLAKTGGAIGRSGFLDTQLDSALKRLAPQAQIGGLRMSPAEAAALSAKY